MSEAFRYGSEFLAVLVRPLRTRRACVAACLVCLACAVVVTPAAALPPQGVYESCSPGRTESALRTCTARLREIRAGGFRVVLNYAGLYGTPSRVRGYARAASELGIRLIWPLHNPVLWRTKDLRPTYRNMAAACRCSSAKRLVPFMVRFVKEFRATWMYYVGDEVDVAEHDRMKAVSRLVRATDRKHRRFFVHFGSGPNLTPFVDTAEVLGIDHYPLFAGHGVAEDVATAARGTQRVARAAGKPTAMVLQAFSWGPHFKPLAERWPTVGEYRMMRDAARANSHPRVILWWAYYVIQREAEAALHWRQLVDGAAAPRVRVRDLAAASGRTRTVRVRFRFSSRSRARVRLRCGGRSSVRQITGTRRTRKLRMTMPGRGPCRVTVAPVGGDARTVRPR